MMDAWGQCCVCASGDVMGPTLNNLDKLLRLPFGCGEQNMIHFAPNVFVLKYLQKTRQLSPEVENEATDYLLQGKERWAILSLPVLHGQDYRPYFCSLSGNVVHRTKAGSVLN